MLASAKRSSHPRSGRPHEAGPRARRWPGGSGEGSARCPRRFMALTARPLLPGARPPRRAGRRGPRSARVQPNRKEPCHAAARTRLALISRPENPGRRGVQLSGAGGMARAAQVSGTARRSGRPCRSRIGLRDRNRGLRTTIGNRMRPPSRWHGRSRCSANARTARPLPDSSSGPGNSSAWVSAEIGSWVSKQWNVGGRRSGR